MTPQLPEKDLIGKSFGFLTVVESVGSKRKSWLCRCVCGKIVKQYESALLSLHKKSCGCMTLISRKQNIKKHGKYPEDVYKIWVSMNQRCFNKNDRAFGYYGGRGITTCDEWRFDFKKFRDDMGPRPGKEFSLDRIDNNTGYSKENCRWATKKEQSNNNRKVVKVSIDGEIRNLREWCHHVGITISSLVYRRKKLNISNEDAIRFYLERCRNNQELQKILDGGDEN